MQFLSASKRKETQLHVELQRAAHLILKHLPFDYWPQHAWKNSQEGGSSISATLMKTSKSKWKEISIDLPEMSIYQKTWNKQTSIFDIKIK